MHQRGGVEQPAAALGLQTHARQYAQVFVGRMKHTAQGRRVAGLGLDDEIRQQGRGIHAFVSSAIAAQRRNQIFFRGGGRIDRRITNLPTREFGSKH